jgi:hypothetical protein
LRIVVDITDRELLDLDTAVSDRRIKLNKELLLHRLPVEQIQEEIASLDIIMDKLFTAVNESVSKSKNDN